MDPQQVTPTVSPSPVVEQKPPHSNRMFKVLLLVFLVLLLGAVITYAFQNYQQPLQSDLLPHPGDGEVTPPVEEASEWKTYTSEEYGFEFKYPGELFYESCGIYAYDVVCTSFFTIGSTPMFSMGGHDGNEYMTFHIQRHDLTLEQLKDEHLTTSSNSSTSFQINGLSGYKILSDSNLVIYLFASDNLIYSIFTRNLNALSSVEKILSTFRFVEEGNQITTKECKNTFLKVTMQIPADWTCDSKAESGSGWININSDKFGISISNLGRGGPCGSGPVGANCKHELFFQNDILTLNNYFNSNVEGYEIFGDFNSSARPWVSIQPKDKSRKEPSPEEAVLLKEVFESLQILP